MQHQLFGLQPEMLQDAARMAATSPSSAQQESMVMKTSSLSPAKL
jgi:hypothetical protein